MKSNKENKIKIGALVHKVTMTSVSALMSLSLISCKANIEAKGNNKPLSTKPPIDIEGTWATTCTLHQFFNFYEINVYQFTDLNLKYSNYRFSDSKCANQTSLEQKTGEMSFGVQNSDLSYNVDYLIDIGQGAQQFMFDVIKREGDKIYFGEFMSSDESSRSAFANMNAPYSKVSDGYTPIVEPQPAPPQPTPPQPTPPQPVNPEGTFLGETTLTMNNNSFSASNLTTNMAFKNYKYSSSTKQILSIDEVSGSDSCSDWPVKKFKWIEVLENNSFGTTIDVPMWTHFTAEANKNYILQLSVSGIMGCYAGYNFSLGTGTK